MPRDGAKIYISSTYSDLREYRKAVYDILRKARHDVIAMEDYVATDERPLDKCLEDVSECDIYIGIFAWRYGYIPDKDNPQQQSITELEYRKAGEERIPRLIFLLTQDADWKPPLMDAVTGDGDSGKRITTLREEIGKDKMASFFKTSDELAGLVSVAVQNAWERLREQSRREETRHQPPKTPSGSRRIFISYARSDGETFAKDLRQQLIEKYGFSLWQDRTDLEGGKGWWQQIIEALNYVEYMVLVITPDALRSDIVRKEWRLARQRGVCVIPVSATPNLDFDKLPRWMQKTHFVDPDVPEQWTRFIHTLESPCHTPRVPFMVEDLPEDFVPRPNEFKQLIAQVLDEQREEAVAITAALRGAGGYGKTTLAKALCHDPRVQDAFHDGILWVTLGENPGDLTKRVQDLIYTLSGEQYGFTDINAARTRLGELLANRDILLVIDDVWNEAHLKPFLLQRGTHYVLLITTRDSATLPANSKRVDVDAMRRNEAVSLLKAGLPPGEDETLQTLASRLSDWPLLLKLVNAALRDRVHNTGQPLPAVITYVNKALDRHGLTAFDAQNAVERNQAVEKTIGVSLELLSESEQSRYSELAIFPEDVEIPLATLEKLWRQTGGFDDFETEKLCGRLFQISLLLRYDAATQHIRLHDAMRKFLEEKQRENLTALHDQLLNAYGIKAWVALPADEPYLWNHLAYHLAKAGHTEQLRLLLLDFNWLQAKLNATDATSVIADYDFLPDDQNLWFVQRALQLSALFLAQDKTQLRSQLYGRLLSRDVPQIHALREQLLQRTEVPWLRLLTPSLTQSGGPLLQTLAGHSGWVNAVALTLDGQQVVSASADRTLKVWDLARGMEVQTLSGHSGSVTAVVLAPDGQQVVSASADRTLKVWDLEQRRKVQTLSGHTNWIKTVALTPDGERAISTSIDHTLRVWNLASKTEEYLLTGHEGWVNAVTVTPDGKQAISASDDKTLKVWDLAKGTEVRTLRGHTGRVKAVAVIPNEKQVISASADRTLKVWNLIDGAEVHTLKSHNLWVKAVEVTQDGRQAISASFGCLQVWDLASGTEDHLLTGHEGWVNAVAVTPDGKQAISASNDRTLKVWDLASGKEARTLRGHTGRVKAVAVIPNEKQVLSAAEDKTLKVWDLAQGREDQTIWGHTDWVKAVEVTPDERQAISASYDGTLEVWDLASGTEVHLLTGHKDWIKAVAVTRNGKQAISASSDHTLKVWDLASGKEVRTLKGHKDVVRAVALTPDSRRAVSASEDCTLKMWDLASGEVIGTLEGHDRRVTAVVVTRDGCQAVSTSEDCTLKVWDLVTRAEVRTLAGHTELVIAVAVTRDGKRVISASNDHTLKVWDLASGAEVRTLAGYIDEIWVVAITPDGKRVISASNDHTLKVWDLASGAEVRTLAGHTGRISRVALTANGRLAISASKDRTLRVWNLQSGENIASFGGDGPLESCAVAQNGGTIIAGEESGRVHFLRLEGTEEI